MGKPLVFNTEIIDLESQMKTKEIIVDKDLNKRIKKQEGWGCEKWWRWGWRWGQTGVLMSVLTSMCVGTGVKEIILATASVVS